MLTRHCWLKNEELKSKFLFAAIAAIRHGKSLWRYFNCVFMFCLQVCRWLKPVFKQTSISFRGLIHKAWYPFSLLTSTSKPGTIFIFFNFANRYPSFGGIRIMAFTIDTVSLLFLLWWCHTFYILITVHPSKHWIKDTRLASGSLAKTLMDKSKYIPLALWDTHIWLLVVVWITEIILKQKLAPYVIWVID